MPTGDKPSELRQTRVFISYSRSESMFAESLRNALQAQDFEAFLDKHDVAAGEPWQERLSGLIMRADTIVFCLSPNFVASDVCDWEVNEAERLGKRLIPVVAVETPNQDVPQRLKRLNYIFMREEHEIGSGLSELAGALKTDISWIREQTRLVELAERWDQAKKLGAEPLRGQELEDAERWLLDRPHHAPEPTDVLKRYIRESRDTQNLRQRRDRRRNRVIAVASLTAAMVMTALSALMYMQWQLALATQSGLLAERARKVASEGDAVTAMLLAVEALPDRDAEFLSRARWRPEVPAARSALDIAWRTGGVPIRVLDHGREVDVETARFSMTGRYVLTTANDRKVRLWSSSGTLLNTYAIADPQDKNQSIISAEIHPDERHVLIVFQNATQLWELMGDRPLKSLAHRLPDSSSLIPRRARFSPSGRTIVTAADDGSIAIWDKNGEPLRDPTTHHSAPIVSISFQKGKKFDTVLTASRDGTAVHSTVDGLVLASVETKGRVALEKAVFGPSPISITTLTGFEFIGSKLPDGVSYNTVETWVRYQGNSIQRNSIQEIARPQNTSRAPSRIKNVYSSIARDIGNYPGEERILTLHRDDRARLWKTNGGGGRYLIAELGGHYKDSLWTAAFGRHGERVLTATAPNISALTASGDPVILAAGNARLWDINGNLLAILKGHKARVNSVAFDHNGALAVTASDDGTARIWQLDGQLVAVYKERDALIRSNSKWRDVLDDRADDKARPRKAVSEMGAAIMINTGLSEKLFYFDESEARNSRRRGKSHPGQAYHLKEESLVATEWAEGWRVWRYVTETAYLVDEVKRVVPRCLTGDERANFGLPPEVPRWCSELRKPPYDGRTAASKTAQ